MRKILSIKSHKGFSLIELLITVTILVLTATAVIPVFTFVTQANNQNKIRSTANSIATGIFEEISSMKYEDIGTPMGSPSGTVNPYREVTIDDILYKVYVQISWGSATDLLDVENPVAFKNIRVIVKATGAFTGTEDTIDKMYSIVAKEGQQSITGKGNIRVLIQDFKKELIVSPTLNVKASSGAKTYNVETEDGQAIFGEINLGTYSVYVPIPDNYYVPQHETIDAGNVVRDDIEIDGWSVEDVHIYMDKLENHCKMSIKIIDDLGQAFPCSGKITITCNLDETKYTVFSDKPFTNGVISYDEIDRLSPLGNYNIIIEFDDPYDHLKYNMETSSKPVIAESGTEWNGTFSGTGETINLLIPISSTDSTKDAFSIIEAESYDDSVGNFTKASADGGDIILNMLNNNYTVYKNVDFDTGAYRFIARAAGGNARTVTLRVDSANGPIIGTLNFNSTGNNSTYQEQSCWVNGITGVHDLYIVYSGNFRFNWFTFRRAYDYDDFNDNTISNAWTFINGNWVEEGGVLKQTSTSEQDPKKAILSNANFSQTTNYTIMAKVRVQNWTDNWWINDDMARAGVGLFTDSNNGQGYNLLFHQTNNRVQFLDDMRGWSTEFQYRWYENVWYWFKLKSEGQKLYGKIWQEGYSEPSSWLFEYTFDNPRTGYPSLNGGSGDCQVWFDDVSITTE